MRAGLFSLGAGPRLSLAAGDCRTMNLFVTDWVELISALVLLLAIYLIATVILYKRNEVAAAAWVGLLILSPLFGCIAYLLFGINRIRRRTVRVRGARSALTTFTGAAPGRDPTTTLAGQAVPVRLA